MGHPNTDVVRRGFAAFASGDMATMNEVLSDDIVWHSPGNNKWSGDYEGKGQVLEFFGGITGEADEISNELHAVLADDEHAVALVNATTTKGGKSVTGHAAFVFHMKDGQATECWIHNDNQAELDALWGS